MHRNRNNRSNGGGGSGFGSGNSNGVREYNLPRRGDRATFNRFGNGNNGPAAAPTQAAPDAAAATVNQRANERIVETIQVEPPTLEIERRENTQTPAEDFPPELLIKHPLQNTWTLWYFELDKSKSWEESQREITSFDTAEDFWSMYHHIKTASELKNGCDYSMFKHGIRPMWEDKANKQGGRWLINLDKKQRSTELDHFWLEILLCMIGEGFNEYSDDICGAVVNVRTRTDKIAVWTGDASVQASVMEIGRKLKERLKITPKITIGYQVHKDTMVQKGSTTKNTYVI
ncbi:unnamed protein product [Trichogramma brassicae]|uniref:eIF-4F 25 kDa subunit n=1 Tax=Trichogramma brassicae TaxID=86971 RepID=A0A6H5IDR2_9HYME|nr:unnamed protein product [Trichogramma brassicae]